MMLSDKMKEALRDVAFGVRKYRNGYFCIDEPEKRVHSKTLDALSKLGLITWFGAGGATHQIHLKLTEEGRKTFNELYPNI